MVLGPGETRRLLPGGHRFCKELILNRDIMVVQYSHEQCNSPSYEVLAVWRLISLCYEVHTTLISWGFHLR